MWDFWLKSKKLSSTYLLYKTGIKYLGQSSSQIVSWKHKNILAKVGPKGIPYLNSLIQKEWINCPFNAFSLSCAILHRSSSCDRAGEPPSSLSVPSPPPSASQPVTPSKPPLLGDIAKSPSIDSIASKPTFTLGSPLRATSTPSKKNSKPKAPYKMFTTAAVKSSSVSGLVLSLLTVLYPIWNFIRKISTTLLDEFAIA